VFGLSMLTRIQSIKAATSFDFRAFAAPEDPLGHLFPEWVDYYRTKFAICRAVNPRSILEVGVRYGYSAITFLNAAPGASYVGIDNDSNEFGGQYGALDWARKLLTGYPAQILVADSQRLASFPGDYYDLIHVDGQQDGDSTFRDLELGLEKGRWLLVDGYFWSRENMLSATCFMEKYQRLIAGAYVIPGYAGDLLIETHTRADRKVFRAIERHHSALHDAYDADYFMRDCGGYEAFKLHKGTVLADARLRTLHHMCAPVPGMRILDIGCGRGEVAFACFDSGASVVGLDYSVSAIEIAKTAFVDHLGDRLNFVHADILEYEPPHKFDAILMADVVEHLSPEALDAAFARCASWLLPGGRLIIHTWPNRLAYEHNHAVRRRALFATGGYVPKNPRSYYEDLMHINEQTPAKLRRSLALSFPHVEILLAGDKGIELLRPSGLRHLVRTAENIFAVASDSLVDRNTLEKNLFQLPVLPDVAGQITIANVSLQRPLRAGSRTEVAVTLANNSDQALASLPPFPIHLSYHWYRNSEVVEFDGVRTALRPKLESGRTRDYRMSIMAPSTPGQYVLGISLVQEGRFWFEQVAAGAICQLPVEVIPSVSETLS